MSKQSGHPLKRVLYDNQQVFSMVVDNLIREIGRVVPFYAMAGYLDWESPPAIWEMERILRCRLEIVQFELDKQIEVYKKRRDELCERVRDVFDRVELGSGISISQANVIDDYGGEKEQQQARTRDSEGHWSLVDVEAKDPGGSAMTFMDAKGFRFYLPAYMINDLMRGLIRLGECSDSNAVGSLLWQLDSKLHADSGCYEILSLPEKQCVAEFLLLIWEVENDKDSLTALRRHWIEYLPQEIREAIN